MGGGLEETLSTPKHLGLGAVKALSALRNQPFTVFQYTLWYLKRRRRIANWTSNVRMHRVWRWLL